MNELDGLVIRCRSGDQGAWAELFRRFSPMVWTVARSFGLRMSDCEDVLQLTWLRVVEHLHALREPAKLNAWIVTAARRESMKLLNRSVRQLPIGAGESFETTVDDGATPEETALARSENEQALLAFWSLPEKHRNLLGMLLSDPAPSYDEISAALAMPRGSIGPTRNRILRRMREMLQAPEFDLGGA